MEQRLAAYTIEDHDVGPLPTQVPAATEGAEVRVWPPIAPPTPNGTATTWAAVNGIPMRVTNGNATGAAVNGFPRRVTNENATGTAVNGIPAHRPVVNGNGINGQSNHGVASAVDFSTWRPYGEANLSPITTRNHRASFAGLHEHRQSLNSPVADHPTFPPGLLDVFPPSSRRGSRGHICRKTRVDESGHVVHEPYCSECEAARRRCNERFPRGGNNEDEDQEGEAE